MSHVSSVVTFIGSNKTFLQVYVFFCMKLDLVDKQYMPPVIQM